MTGDCLQRQQGERDRRLPTKAARAVQEYVRLTLKLFLEIYKERGQNVETLNWRKK